jgi:hypothetical protein
MEREVQKVERVQQQQQGQHSQETDKVKAIGAKDNKVLENREAQLRALRQKLQAKEEHAKKVREAKRRQTTGTM